MLLRVFVCVFVCNFIARAFRTQSTNDIERRHNLQFAILGNVRERNSEEGFQTCSHHFFVLYVRTYAYSPHIKYVYCIIFAVNKSINGHCVIDTINMVQTKMVRYATESILKIHKIIEACFGHENSFYFRPTYVLSFYQHSGIGPSARHVLFVMHIYMLRAW